jgi:hypothetical protein
MDRERTGDGPVTEHDMDHVVEHRTSYYISFFFVLLIFLINFFIKFDQVLDVMLQSISSPRREAASPPLLRCTLLKKCSYTQISCSYTLCLTVDMRDTVLPYFNGPVDGQGESDTNNCNLAGHGRCFSGWGRLLIDLKYFGFLVKLGGITVRRLVSALG